MLEDLTPDHQDQQPSPREIAEKMLNYHTDGTVIATAEVLQVDLHSLWDHFLDHLDPSLLATTSDPIVLAYLWIKCFENWCMDQLSESYITESEGVEG